MPHGYDLNDRLSYRLLKGRLGIYDKSVSHDTVHDSEGLTGLADMGRRLNHQGGASQQDRMIADKRRTLMRVLNYSYQGAKVHKWEEHTEYDSVKALINPNRVKQDYDDKIISIFYDYDYKPGTIFEWENTGTYWLIYLQDSTELAYFRGDIRKCSHEIAWLDEDGEIHRTYAAIRGPVETKVVDSTKSGTNMDAPNYTLSILLPKTPEILDYFRRYSKFYLQGDVHYNVCWRVETADWISMPGVLEITAIEYYRNLDEDDIAAGLVGTLAATPINPNPDEVEETIVGDTFIKPGQTYQYNYYGNVQAEWSVDEKLPVKIEQHGKTVYVTWKDSLSGQFELSYGDLFKKTIVVESLF